MKDKQSSKRPRPTRSPASQFAGLAMMLCAAAWTTIGTPAHATGLVSLAVDQATVLQLDKPASTVILGNPLIADALVQDTNTLVLTGRSFGITNIIVLDVDGTEILNAQLSVDGGAGASHVVTLHRATARTSLSCTPECERAPMVGDDGDLFDQLAGQITARHALSSTD